MVGGVLRQADAVSAGGGGAATPPPKGEAPYSKPGKALARWNDFQYVTHEMVLALLDEAITEQGGK